MKIWSPISDAKTHDSRISKELFLKPGSIVAIDRGFVDFAQFRSWTEQGIFFVTRMKDNAVYAVDKVRMPPKGRTIVSDKIVHLAGTAAKKYPGQLRRIVVKNPEKDNEEIVLLPPIISSSERAG